MAPVVDPNASFAAIPVAVGILAGTSVFVILVIAAVVAFRRRSFSKRIHDSNMKQFLLPKNVKPVISFKTAAGPGGLKKTPSPVQSPEFPEGGNLMETSQRSEGSGESQHEQDLGFGPNEEGGIDMEPLEQSVCVQKSGSEQEPEQGFLNFNVRYNFEKNALVVTINGAKDLPMVKEIPRCLEESTATGGASLDPYVKLQLLPEKQHKVKTRVVRNTLNPVYDEEFVFYGINFNQLQSTTLHFAIISFDRYSRDEIIGEVLCPLYSVDLTDSEKEASLSLPLVARNLKFQNARNRGEMLISMCYQPATNRLTAVVLKAKNLPKFDVTGMADPYVKVYLLFNGERIAKKKSHVKKRTLSPVYNESFVFELPTKDIEGLGQVGLEFYVMDWDRLTKNEVMGRVQVGMTSKAQLGRSHWAEVIQNPRKQIAEWHKLHP